MKATLTDQQQAIYHEMMSHPALFTHPHPQKVAIIGDEQLGITQEVLKHPNVCEVWKTVAHKNINDPRIKLLALNDDKNNFFDIIIIASELHRNINYFSFLQNAGILLQPSTSPFDLAALKSHYDQLDSLGFYDIQVLNFPQPDRPTGWSSALMAVKQTAFKRVREKDIYNRLFTTRYYNFDVHKASLVLPEFMREQLTSE